MNRYEAQKALFAERPARLALQALPAAEVNDAGSSRWLRINVWRNHAIESVVSLAQPYFEWSCLRPVLQIGPYDDTLQFVGHQPADLELLWLDSTRYRDEAEWMAWLAERLLALRALSSATILLVTWSSPDNRARLQSLVDGVPGVRFADLQAFAYQAGAPLLDVRTAKASGTPVASALHARLARKLVCHWIAGCVLAPVKAIAVDLDNTIHAGVLGEDGPRDVALTPGHLSLQMALKEIRARGVFLALVSRNEDADVQSMFSERPDYPLRPTDFSAIEASWDPKVDALKRVASRLNIGTDAIAFVDDNLGELLNVTAAMPEMPTVFAEVDAELTRRVVMHLPGLWRWSTSEDDAMRIADVSANAVRTTLLNRAVDQADYFRDLQVVLQWRVDAADQLDRLTDLCAKTNQFNLAIRRFKHADLWHYMQSPQAHVVSVRMRDRLADSGVVAVIVTRREDCRLIVDELCISCRALGRGLEDAIVLAALQRLPLFQGCTEVAVQVTHGARNQPALHWLTKLIGPASHDGPLPEGEHSIAMSRIRDFTAPTGLTLSSGD